MDTSTIVDEHRVFPSGRLGLAGVLSYPTSGEPTGAVLLCAPHPNLAGNMENNVILALARRLGATNIVLRFDYRGVGESEIDLPPEVSAFEYWSAAEESQDYRAALADVAAAAKALRDCAGPRPLTVVGYSFGAVVGLQYGHADPSVRALVGISPPLTRCDLGFLAECRKPCLLLSGTDDFVCSAEKSAALRACCGPSIELVLLEGLDHFYRGAEETVAERVAVFWERVVAV